MLRRVALPAVALAGLLALAACGNASPSTASSSGSAPSTTAAAITVESTIASSSTAPTSTVPKPAVKLPTSTPTSLVTTVNTPGTGPAAADGDIVVVNYVGVRSEDGTEFDNSYDSGQPFPLKLGAGSVIKGWDQGLVGVQTGEQLQLDVPADLAYGDSPTGEVIKPGDVLSFVIDVLAVVPATTEYDQPQVSVSAAPNREDLLTEDLVVGDGATLTDGQTAVMQLLAFRADTGEQTASTWAESAPVAVVFGEEDTPLDLNDALKDMKVGGRRQVTVPAAMAFEGAGNESLGLPANTDVILVVDLVAAY